MHVALCPRRRHHEKLSRRLERAWIRVHLTPMRAMATSRAEPLPSRLADQANQKQQDQSPEQRGDDIAADRFGVYAKAWR